MYSQCLLCKHHFGGDTCKAFQDKIPDIILENKHDHRKPYSKDGGIQFDNVLSEAASKEADGRL